MKKHFILNLFLNLGIIFLFISGVAAYQSGNMLILGASIAIAVVLIYLKIVLLKYVNKDIAHKQQSNIKETKIAKSKTKKGNQ